MNHSLLHIISLIFGLIFGSLTAEAATVTGIVSDRSDNSTLPFCTVRILPGERLLSTDADGVFRVNLGDGYYTVTISYVGYSSATEKITVKGKDQTIRISLTPNSLTLGEVVVTAKESEGISSGSRIDRAAMSHLQPSSFTDLLELLPGNISKNPQMGQANTINLRETGTLGATGSATSNPDYSITSLGTLFVVDGSPVVTDANMQTVGTISDTSSPDFSRNITNKGVDMRSISTDNIESVEIVRGIPSAEYGNLTSGMVNIRRRRSATPLTARFKADEWSKLFFIGKGFNLPGSTSVINADLGYMDSKIDPRSNLENYKRLTASLRYNGSSNFRRGLVRYNVNADYTGSFDNTKTDPDLSNGKVDEYSSRYSRMALNFESVCTFTDRLWLNEVSLTGAASYQDDVLERRKQVAPSRPSAAPTSMEPGVHDGRFLIGEYLADYRCEGKPFNSFLKISASGTASTGAIHHGYRAGVEWTRSKNYGEGQIYDLMKPISASWTSRPRRFADIPALNLVAFYVQDMITFKSRAGDVDLQLGLRGTALAGLNRSYAMAGNVYLDPRANLLWHLPSAGKLKLFVGGGYGITSKMPTVDYLYPQEHYNDLIQLNYYDLNSPLEKSRLNIMTYIDDASNRNLTPARNRKAELRLGGSIGDNRLSVTIFSEKLTSGFRYMQCYSSYAFRKYDASAINMSELTGQPSLDELPYSDERVLDGFRRVTNGSGIDKKGVEFQLNTARWKPLRTSLIITGAWFRTTYSYSQMLYSPVSDVIDGVAVSDRYVGLYDYSDGRVNEQFNTNFMFDTQLNNLGLVFTTSVQCMWFVKSTMISKNGTPAMYLDASDDQLHPFTAESASDPMLRALIKTYNDNQFLPVRIAPAIYLNFKASKSIGRLLRVSLFVNRIIDYLPDYKVNGLTVRRTSDAYFGMELNLTI